MKSLLHRLSHRLRRNKITRNIILIGIDYPSFSLGKAVTENPNGLNIVAFIDEEPWTNKTQLHGVTVYYPSDLMTLIKKHQVELVVQFDNQKPKLHQSLLDELSSTGLPLLTLENSLSTDIQIAKIMETYPST